MNRSELKDGMKVKTHTGEIVKIITLNTQYNAYIYCVSPYDKDESKGFFLSPTQIECEVK